MIDASATSQGIGSTQADKAAKKKAYKLAWDAANKEKLRLYMAEYNLRPGNKEKAERRSARYRSRPEIKERKRLYDANHRPAITPENKEKARLRGATPAYKEKSKIRDARRRLNADHKEKKRLYAADLRARRKATPDTGELEKHRAYMAQWRDANQARVKANRAKPETKRTERRYLDRLEIKEKRNLSGGKYRASEREGQRAHS